jgi:putative transposase
LPPGKPAKAGPARRTTAESRPSDLARAFEDCLSLLSIRHIRCSPHHPQTNGKLERSHETLKTRLNLFVYTSPGNLRAAMAEFMEFL